MARAKKLPSGRWRALVYDYTDNKGKRHYKSFTADTKKEAEFLAAQFSLEKKDIERSVKENLIPFREALDTYISEREKTLSPGTIREYRRSQRTDFKEIEGIFICDLTQDVIQSFINEKSKNHSPKTVRNIHGIICAVMARYFPDKALKTVLPKKVRPSLYIPSDNEIKALISYVQQNDPEMEVPILLAAFGPMRRGEICALRSENISGNIVHVCRSMVLNSENKWVIKAPKSYAGDRLIEFPDFVIEKIKNIRGSITQFNPAMVSNHFSSDLRRAGLPHFRFHDLRHYSASIQHAIGIPDAYIMQRGGWGSDTVLKTIYRHALEEKEKEMYGKANKYFSDVMQHKIQHTK